MKAKDWLDVALLATFFFFALAVLAAPLIGPANPRSTVDLWLSFLGTAATVAAVVVALYFGTASQRREREVAQLRATLTAAKLVAQVKEVGRQIGGTCAAIVFMAAREDKVKTFNNVFIQNLNPDLLGFDDEDLMSLVPLRGQVGHRLRGACERLRLLRRDVGIGLAQGKWVELPPGEGAYRDVSDWMLDWWCKELLECHEMLTFVQSVLEEAASAGAPRVHLSEVYRDDIPLLD
ncbi:hypothetical protein ACFJGW_00740 [Burkholderiaceae bacterium UC74_6]